MQHNNPRKHRALKALLIVLAIILLPIATLLIVQWVRYMKDPDPYKTFLIPRLELSVFEVTTLDLDKTDMVGTMLIHNPLPINLRADSLQYKIFISGQEVIKSSYAKSINIKHWDSTLIRIPVSIYSEKLMKILTDAENAGKDSVVYEVQASFATNIIFRKSFDVKIEKLLPLIFIPKVKLERIEYDSLNAEGVTLYLNTTIANKNQFGFEFKDLSFRFALADNPWVKGSVPGVISIPDSSVVPLTLPLRISFKQIGKSILPLIKEGKNTDFKFELNLKLVSDQNYMKNSLVMVKDVGTIKEITQIVKEQKQEQRAENKAARERGETPLRDKRKANKKKDKVEFGKREK